jgi:hypothetical protein
MMRYTAFFLLFTVFAGCSGSPSRPADFPATVPCHVTVLDGNQPLENCTVTFHPAEIQGFAVIARTDANGVAVMQTIQGHYAAKGVPAGQSVVTLTEPSGGKTDNGEELPQVRISGNRSGLQAKKGTADSGQGIPPKLTKKNSSPLTFDGTSDKITINLADYR